jgi:uncharacterized protein YggE
MRPANHRPAFAAAIAALLLAAPAMAESVPPAIAVTGEATVSAAPDQAEIEAGVTTEAKTAREASETNNAAMGKLLLALKAANIDQKDVQTSRLSLQPQSASNKPGGAPTIVGYRAANRVTVKLHDVLRVAGTIDMLVGAGATDVGGINFSVSNASNLLDDAREQALADARRKAEIYAKAAGVTLGAPLNIAEGSGPGPIMYRRMALGMAAAPTPVAPGEETLQVTVSVSWAITQARQ